MMVKQETCFGAAFKCKGAAESVSTPSSFKKFCILHFCAINYTKQNLPLRPFVHPSLAQLILHKYALFKKNFCLPTNDSPGFHSWHQVDHNWSNFLKAWLSPETSANLEDGPSFPPVQIEIQLKICIWGGFVCCFQVASLPACGRLLWQPSKGQCWKLCCRPRSWDVLLHSHCPAHQVRGTTYYGGCEDAYQGTSHVLESTFTSV